MTVVDFIDVIDDIVDLSSDEETVQQDDIATQPHATLLDRQAVFVLGGEGRQDVQAAFVSGGEGSQEATESENALVATVSSVTEKEPLHAAESQNCHSSPAAPFSSLTSITPKVPSSEVGDTKQAAFVSAGEANQEATESGNALVDTAPPWVMEKVPLDTSKNSPSSPASTPLPSGDCTTPKDLSSEDGDTQLVATVSPSGMEKAPLDTAETKNCPSSPTSAPLLSSASTAPKALTSEDGDTPLVATVSPSVMEKALLNTAESNYCPSSPASAPLLSPASTTPKALTSEDCDRKLVRAKYHKKMYRTSNPRRSPRLLEYCTPPVEELAADHKRPRMLQPAEESAVPPENTESTKTCSTDSVN